MEYPVTMTTHVPEGTFLVTFSVTVPAGGPAVEDAEAREADRARDLAGQGHLARLWGLPGG